MHTTRRSDRGPAWAVLGSVTALGAFAAVAPMLLKRVADAPDDAESIRGTLAALGWLAVVAMAALGAVIAASVRSAEPRLRRVGRFATWAAVLGVVFWYLPTPFWATRILTFAILAALAGLYLTCVLRLATRLALRKAGGARSARLSRVPGVAGSDQVGAAPAEELGIWVVWAAPVAAAGVVLSVSLAALLIRYSNMGWQMGID